MTVDLRLDSHKKEKNKLVLILKNFAATLDFLLFLMKERKLFTTLLSRTVLFYFTGTLLTRQATSLKIFASFSVGKGMSDTG